MFVVDISICEHCGREYLPDWKKGHTRKQCNSCRSNRVGKLDRKAVKQRMVDYRGGACQRCGYSRCLRALDFHHVDPSAKRMNLSSGAFNRSWESLRAELDKCVLLCSNCHFEVEASSRGRPRPRREDVDWDTECERCGRRFRYERRKGMTRTRCNSCRGHRASPEARRELKRWMIDYKGGRCRICGYDRQLAALTFHHREPAEKHFSIAGSHARSLDALRRELDKCDLVCANCHDEIEDAKVSPGPRSRVA